MNKHYTEFLTGVKKLINWLVLICLFDAHNNSLHQTVYSEAIPDSDSVDSLNFIPQILSDYVRIKSAAEYLIRLYNKVSERPLIRRKWLHKRLDCIINEINISENDISELFPNPKLKIKETHEGGGLQITVYTYEGFEHFRFTSGWGKCFFRHMVDAFDVSSPEHIISKGQYFRCYVVNAFAYWRLGQYDNAKKYFEKALEYLLDVTITAPQEVVEVLIAYIAETDRLVKSCSNKHKD